MATDERAKEQEWVATNVRTFTPRTAVSALKTMHGSRPLATGRDVINNDDDTGLSAA
jgi:hypothetical protein